MEYLVEIVVCSQENKESFILCKRIISADLDKFKTQKEAEHYMNTIKLWIKFIKEYDNFMEEIWKKGKA